jgi:hypothetical protein
MDRPWVGKCSVDVSELFDKASTLRDRQWQFDSAKEKDHLGQSFY